MKRNCHHPHTVCTQICHWTHWTTRADGGVVVQRSTCPTDKRLCGQLHSHFHEQLKLLDSISLLRLIVLTKFYNILQYLTLPYPRGGCLQLNPGLRPQHGSNAQVLHYLIIPNYLTHDFHVHVYDWEQLTAGCVTGMNGPWPIKTLLKDDDDGEIRGSNV